MTNLDTINKLDNYEDEDIFDVVVKLENSFGLKFEKDAFYEVKTFGHLCDVFESYISKYKHQDDCTKQQAFYKVQEALVQTQQIDAKEIQLDTNLSDLFPAQFRRRKIQTFKKNIGIDIKMLTYPDWLATTFVVGFLLSLLAFFYNWKIALGGIVFFYAAMKVAEKSGRTLAFQTVRDVAEHLASEHYTKARRARGTYNKQEVLQTIIETFSYDLDIKKSNLNREEKFSWTKSTAFSSGMI